MSFVSIQENSKRFVARLCCCQLPLLQFDSQGGSTYSRHRYNLKWVGIVLAAGFVGYFGRYLAMMIIEKTRKKEPESPPDEEEHPSEEVILEQQRAKLEKKRVKAEAKKAKKAQK